LTPAQATAYARKGKKKKGVKVDSDQDVIEANRQHRLKMLHMVRRELGG
jgi:hypothetical protein